MRLHDGNDDRRRPRPCRALLESEFDRLIESTRGARTAFGLDVGGAISWRLAGPVRSLLYRLAAETGLSAVELGSLTDQSFDFDPDLATVTVGAGVSPRRRRECRPIRQSTAAAIREHLIDCGSGEPAFQLPHRDELDRMFRVDLDAAGIGICRIPGREVGFSMLRVTFLRALRARRSQHE